MKKKEAFNIKDIEKPYKIKQENLEVFKQELKD